MIFDSLDWITIIVICAVLVFLTSLLIIKHFKKKNDEKIIKEEYGFKTERY